MKTLRDLGIVPIKPETKSADETVKKALEEVNQTIYDYAFRYVSDVMAYYLQNRFEFSRGFLRDNFNSLDNVAKNRAIEIGKKLNEYIEILSVYQNTLDGENYYTKLSQMQKCINFRVSEYLKEIKGKNISEENLLKFAKMTKELNNFYKMDELDKGHFEAMQRQVIEKLSKQLSFNITEG